RRRVACARRGGQQVHARLPAGAAGSPPSGAGCRARHARGARAPPGRTGKAALASVQGTNKTYSALETEFLQLAEAGKLDEARDLVLHRLNRAQAEYIQGLDKLVDVMEEDTKDEVRDSAAIYQAGLKLLVGAGVICALLGAA